MIVLIYFLSGLIVLIGVECHDKTFKEARGLDGFIDLLSLYIGISCFWPILLMVLGLNRIFERRRHV